MAHLPIYLQLVNMLPESRCRCKVSTTQQGRELNIYKLPMCVRVCVCVCVCVWMGSMCLACVCVQRLQGSTKRERQQARVETSLSCRIFPMKIWDIVSGRAGWRGGHPGRSWAPSRAAQPSTGELSSTKSCELILACPCAPISSQRILTLDPY